MTSAHASDVASRKVSCMGVLLFLRGDNVPFYAILAADIPSSPQFPRCSMSYLAFLDLCSHPERWRLGGLPGRAVSFSLIRGDKRRRSLVQLNSCFRDWTVQGVDVLSLVRPSPSVHNLVKE